MVSVVDGKKIYYQPLKSWKYRTTKDYSIMCGVFPEESISEPRYCPAIHLDIDGTLTIFRGYAWDGCSGPTIDTANNMRGGLVHDALYQLMRAGRIPKTWKETADELLFRLLREDGMSYVRAKLYLWGVSIGGGAGLKGKEPMLDEIEAP